MIDVRHVGKTFRRPASVRGVLRGQLRGAPFVALTDVSFSVAHGEALGLMGPNGAGKSTILRILAGLLAPTDGEARVCGIDARDAGTALARKIGYVAADERGMQSTLSAREHLAFYAALYGLRRASALLRVGSLLERVGLASHARRPLRELSTGMRRRVALARALLGDPQVLLLDEPTRGVDPAGASALHAHLQAELAEGRAVVIATHDRGEATALCARVAVLQASRLVALAPPEEAATRLMGMHIG